jgi:hypothetical protein
MALVVSVVAAAYCIEPKDRPTFELVVCQADASVYLSP